MSIVITAGTAGRTPLPPQQELEIGVWVDITPPAEGFASTYGVQCVEMDPNNRSTIYCGIDTKGMWRSTNRGQSWSQIGNLDGPNSIKVDPADSSRIVAAQGVRGDTQGYWVSTDSGASFSIPAGFISSSPTMDVTVIVTCPGNWNRQLIGSHGPWTPLSNAGVLETQDGGVTFATHAPEASWPVGSAGPMFLYDPDSETGSADTWGVHTDGDGFWKSANAGTSWTKTSTLSAPHGASRNCYKGGVLYTGGTPEPLRSTDNGDSFSAISALDNYYYYAPFTDGTYVYAQLAFVGPGGLNGLSPPGDLQPFYRSLDGTTWEVLPGGQTFTNGPTEVVVDSVNKLMYAAMLGAGLWVMRYA